MCAAVSLQNAKTVDSFHSVSHIEKWLAVGKEPTVFIAFKSAAGPVARLYASSKTFPVPFGVQLHASNLSAPVMV